MRRALLLLLVPGAASAWTGAEGQFNGQLSVVNMRAAKATATNAVVLAERNVRVTGAVGFPGPGAVVASARVGATLSPAAVASVAARVAARALPTVAVGVALWDLFDGSRLRPAPTGDGFLFDVGLPEEQVPGFCYDFINVCTDTEAGAIAAYQAWWIRANGQGPNFCTVSFDGFNIRAVYKEWDNYNGWGACNQVSNTTYGPPTQRMTSMCPKISDGPRKGMRPGKDPDGKCRSDIFTEPWTFDRAADRVKDSLDPGSTSYNPRFRPDEVFKSAVEWGKSVELPFQYMPIPLDAAELTPAAVPGQKTTEIDGPSRIETEWTYRPGEAVNSAPGSLTIPWKKEEKRTTQQIDPVTGQPIGDPKVSTKVETPAQTPQNPEAQDPCKLRPTSIGCSEFGQVDDVEIPDREIQVEFDPDMSFGAGNAECPAPRTVELGLVGRIEIDNTLLCRWLEMLRPFVIAAAALAGALIFVSGTRGGE